MVEYWSRNGDSVVRRYMLARRIQGTYAVLWRRYAGYESNNSMFATDVCLMESCVATAWKDGARIHDPLRILGIRLGAEACIFDTRISQRINVNCDGDVAMRSSIRYAF